jgi:hypothetical protein
MTHGKGPQGVVCARRLVYFDQHASEDCHDHGHMLTARSIDVPGKKGPAESWLNLAVECTQHHRRNGFEISSPRSRK